MFLSNNAMVFAVHPSWRSMWRKEGSLWGSSPSQTPALSLSSAAKKLPWTPRKQWNSTECEGWVSCCCSPSFHSPRLMMCSEGRWSKTLPRVKETKSNSSNWRIFATNESVKSPFWNTKNYMKISQFNDVYYSNHISHSSQRLLCHTSVSSLLVLGFN